MQPFTRSGDAALEVIRGFDVPAKSASRSSTLSSMRRDDYSLVHRGSALGPVVDDKRRVTQETLGYTHDSLCRSVPAIAYPV